MRQVKESAVDGEKRYRVRFRQGGQETSRTFRNKPDAHTFAALLDSGPDGVAEALSWLASREQQTLTATFGDYFDQWVASLTGITPRTRAEYQALRRRYLASLDPLPLPLISKTHVATIVNGMEANTRSPKTIKNAMHMLSSVMTEAVEDGIITKNPVKRVRLPKQQLIEDEVKFLTTDEAAALIEATPKHYRALVTFLFGTGLRWSEATALQARHVDLGNGTVRVQRAWKRIPGGWEIGPPKSAKSNRTVNAAVPALVAVAPLLRKPNDLVFLTPNGNVVRHANFYNRTWVPSCKRAGLDPRPSPHDCRHSFASWLISEDIGIEAVQDQLGHESLETTRKVYAHLMPAVGVAAGRAASAAMERVLAQRANLAAGTLARALPMSSGD